jgi:hypothetical protein
MSKRKKRKAKAKMAIPTAGAAASTRSHYAIRDPQFVTTLNGVNIYGGPVFYIERVPDLALIIDVSGLSRFATSLTEGNEAAKFLLPPSLFGVQDTPRLMINWDDGTAHGLDREWWQTLVDAIRELPAGSSVGVCCVGGTGRTGTVLAILAALGNEFPIGVDPVQWLRSRYYDDAVETHEQMWYIEKITSSAIHSYPSDFFRWHSGAETDQPETQDIPSMNDALPQGVVTGPL